MPTTSNIVQVAEAFAYAKTAARAKKSRAARAKRHGDQACLPPTGEHYFAFVRHGLEAGIAVDMQNALEDLQMRALSSNCHIGQRERSGR
jgi:hypothetical protein